MGRDERAGKKKWGETRDREISKKKKKIFKKADLSPKNKK
jgi:hypothetical protein